MAHWSLHWSGAQVVMCAIARHLRSLGHSVDFVATVAPGPDFEDFRCECDELWQFLDSSMIPAETYLRAFRDAIVLRKYNLLVCHHSLQAVAVAGLLPTTVGTISVVHDDPLGGDAYVAISNPRAFDMYVGVSEGVARATRSVLGEDAPVVCVLNGVNAGECPPRPVRGEIEALYAGRLTDSQKGVLLLPEIVRLARNRDVPLRLTIVGDGEDRMKLIDDIGACGVCEWVSLLGAQRQAKVFELMERADVLLLPSRHEGLALVLTEAMGRGAVPIAAKLDASTAEVITDGLDGILIEEHRAVLFADAVERLFRQPERLAKMRELGRETVLSRFSEARMADEYEALFERVRRLPVPRRRLQHCPRFMNG